MVDAYDVCAGCGCHIKRTEVHCPFCEAPYTAARARPRPQRVSRAQWLAFGGALAVMGCSGAIESPPSGGTGGAATGGGVGGRAGQSAEPPLRPPIELVPPGILADLPPPNVCAVSGTFACGTTTCDRATQVCFNLNYQPSSCYPDDAGWPFPTQCQGCPTCGCVADAGLPPGCSCSETDDGGGIGIQCMAACYGAPPARLERKALT